MIAMSKGILLIIPGMLVDIMFTNIFTDNIVSY